MKINDRNKWIDIYSDAKQPGAGGKIVNTETLIWSGWAAVWPVRAKESRENMRVGETITHTIRVLYSEDIKPNMRIKYNERSFDIISLINVDERNVYLDMICEEKIIV